jgi:hypothetical protein
MTGLKRFLHRRLGVEGLDAPETDVVLRFGMLFAVLAAAIRILFWAYAGRNWEDAFITVLHSENLVNGLGLTHYLGEGEPPLHGFTSPLSVLVPLVGDLVHVGFGLSFIKIVSVLAGSLTVFYAMAIAIHPKIKLPAPLAVLVMGYLAFEHHQILWGMAGMETQMTTLVLVVSLYFAIAEKPLALGISLGFCMLARPDFAFWTIIAGAYALVRYPRRLPLIVGAALAVYLPWIVFTVWYYGSPVPNTMVAKGLGYPLWTTWPGFDRTPGFVLKQVWLRLTGSYEPGAVPRADSRLRYDLQLHDHHGCRRRRGHTSQAAMGLASGPAVRRGLRRLLCVLRRARVQLVSDTLRGDGPAAQRAGHPGGWHAVARSAPEGRCVVRVCGRLSRLFRGPAAQDLCHRERCAGARGEPNPKAGRPVSGPSHGEERNRRHRAARLPQLLLPPHCL